MKVKFKHIFYIYLAYYPRKLSREISQISIEFPTYFALAMIFRIDDLKTFGFEIVNSCEIINYFSLSINLLHEEQY